MVRPSMFRLPMIAASVLAVFCTSASSAQQQIAGAPPYRLETKKACQVAQVWRDDGSGAKLDGYFFYTVTKDGFYVIGGYGTQNDKSGKHCVTVVREADDNPAGTPALLAAPISWKLIWTDRGTGANKDGSMWHGVPPSNDFVCLGSIPQAGYNRPYLPNYRCVHTTLVEEITTGALLWSDRGSNGREQVSIFKLPVSGSFVAVKGRRTTLRTPDLRRAGARVGARASRRWENPQVSTISSPHFQELEMLVQEAERYKAADPRLLRDLRGLINQRNWVVKLNRLVDAGERARSADPLFLRDLRDLANKYSGKKPKIIWD